MSRKSERISEFAARFAGSGVDPHYAGYFDCFNRGLFYEAHDVLEQLWLPERKRPNDAFYKGLIQLAGAFVHLQKNRLGPAGALFRLSRANLEKYPAQHEHLDVRRVLELVDQWLGHLEGGESGCNPLRPDNAPKLELSIEN